MNWKRPLALSTAALTLGTALAACGNPTAAAPDPTPTPAAEVQSLSTTGSTVKAPKYVFLFIGDGMSYPQIQSTSDFLGALNDADYRQAQPSLDDNGGAILDGPEYAATRSATLGPWPHGATKGRGVPRHKPLPWPRQHQRP